MKSLFSITKITININQTRSSTITIIFATKIVIIKLMRIITVVNIRVKPAIGVSIRAITVARRIGTR